MENMPGGSPVKRDLVMINPTRELVLSKVKELFPEHDPAEILERLDEYGVEPYQRERDRVQLAILWLSKGDMERLVKFISHARRDYRDVLLWSQYLSKEDQLRYHAWLRGEEEMDLK
jgi:hypothetical protein